MKKKWLFPLDYTTTDHFGEGGYLDTRLRQKGARTKTFGARHGDTFLASQTGKSKELFTEKTHNFYIIFKTKSRTKRNNDGKNS